MEQQHGQAGDETPTDGSHRTTLWTMYQNNRRLTAEIVTADGHWELRLFAQGVLFMWHPCALRDAAVAYANLIREDFARNHWYERSRHRSRQRAAPSYQQATNLPEPSARHRVTAAQPGEQ